MIDAVGRDWVQGERGTGYKDVLRMYWVLGHVGCTSNTKYWRLTSTAYYSVLSDTWYK
jgi:hypothetical protein